MAYLGPFADSTVLGEPSNSQLVRDEVSGSSPLVGPLSSAAS
jgi:hypothetical protein